MAKLPYTIEYIRSICTDERIFITAHARRKCFERGIVLDDIKHAIYNDEIIEEYPDDKPFPSCLILGNDFDKICVHVVLSTDKQLINIITAYHPDSERWENDFNTRKRGE